MGLKIKIKKGNTSFLLFYFWDLNLVPIDSASGNLTQCFQKCWYNPRKVVKYENPAQTLEKIIVFFLECGEEVDPWFWNIWIAQWLKFFPITDYTFSILAIFREKWVVKVGPKVESLGLSLFHENSNPSIFLKKCFCLLEHYL